MHTSNPAVLNSSQNKLAQNRANGIRDPNDGKPYYCEFCGSGWNEYGACEDVRCVIESFDAAGMRFKPSPEPFWPEADYSDIMDEAL